MWPWEHLAIGYLGYAVLYRRSVIGSPHRRIPLAAMVVGTQFPDLVDKPMGWAFGVFPGGTSVTHSLFVAPILIAAIWLLGIALDRREAASAFCVGYFLHIPADLIYPIVHGEAPNLNAFLWPVVVTEPATRLGLIGNVSHYFSKFVSFLGTPRGIAYLAFEAALVIAALWMFHQSGDRPVDRR